MIEIGEIREALKKDEYPPEGWYTSKQLRGAWNLQRSQVGEIIREGIEKGVLEMRVFTADYNGVKRKVPHYKQIEAAKK